MNSLLEITQAINDNLPEEALFRIYDFTIRANLNVGKLSLFVLDDIWNCKANFGTKTDFSKEALPSWVVESDVIPDKFEAPFDEFDAVKLS